MSDFKIEQGYQFTEVLSTDVWQEKYARILSEVERNVKLDPDTMFTWRMMLDNMVINNGFGVATILIASFKDFFEFISDKVYQPSLIQLEVRYAGTRKPLYLYPR